VRDAYATYVRPKARSTNARGAPAPALLCEACCSRTTAGEQISLYDIALLIVGEGYNNNNRSKMSQCASVALCHAHHPSQVIEPRQRHCDCREKVLYGCMERRVYNTWKQRERARLSSASAATPSRAIPLRYTLHRKHATIQQRTYGPPAELEPSNVSVAVNCS
jgi:hypothetical protein